ncbi:hypothetical protein ON064_00535 [Planococcus sp. A6]|nr:hypothetical protein [Planococcus sp. A6]MDE0581535.1 hypothetical protein [Planococcus sp. A6]
MILAAYKLTIAIAALITLFTIRDTDWEERMEVEGDADSRSGR